jgi:hypothetical protein
VEAQVNNCAQLDLIVARTQQLELNVSQVATVWLVLQLKRTVQLVSSVVSMQSLYSLVRWAVTVRPEVQVNNHAQLGHYVPHLQSYTSVQLDPIARPGALKIFNAQWEMNVRLDRSVHHLH